MSAAALESMYNFAIPKRAMIESSDANAFYMMLAHLGHEVNHEKMGHRNQLSSAYDANTSDVRSSSSQGLILTAQEACRIVTHAKI